MGCVESKDSAPILCDLENLFILPANTHAVPSSVSSTSSTSSSSSTLRLLKDHPEHAEYVYRTPPNNVSNAPPRDKRRKKELRNENRALQAEVTRLNTLQDSHDVEMQRLRSELDKARNEQLGDCLNGLQSRYIAQRDKISQLTYENSALTEENSSLKELLRRSQSDNDQKEIEIERLNSEINGIAAMESQHFSTLSTELSFLSPLKQVEKTGGNSTEFKREDHMESGVRESINVYLDGILEGNAEKLRMVVHPCCMISNWNSEMAEMRSLSRDAWLNVIHSSSSSSQSKNKANKFEVLSIEILSNHLAMCHLKYDCGGNTMIDMLYLKKEGIYDSSNGSNSYRWIILQKMLISTIDIANERVMKSDLKLKSNPQDYDKENRSNILIPDHNHGQRAYVGPAPIRPIDIRSSLFSSKPDLAPPLLQTDTDNPKKELGSNGIDNMYRTNQKAASCTPLSTSATTSALISTPDFSDI